MFKRGETKVPLDKIPALAKALHVDPAHLFRLALEQYWPDLSETINTIFGPTVTANEQEILIKPWRIATNNLDPAPTPEITMALAKALQNIAA